MAGLDPILANRFEPGLLDIPSYRSISSINRELRIADGAGTTTMMVPSDDGAHILAIYGKFVELFGKPTVETLLPHRSTDHAIDPEPSYKLPYWRIYNLSEFEFRMLKDYIKATLANRFIQRSSSPVAAPILFAMRQDGGLRLCFDYHTYNLVIVKNRYPRAQISAMHDQVREARIFTKLHLFGAYNLIRIKEGDKYKTAVRMPYSQFKSWVMPFGLTNVLATFQSYIDDCLRPYIDDFAVWYLDDKLIYPTHEKEHEEHVRHVLLRLKGFGVYCKAEKCQFGVSEVSFLGYIITPDGVGMESDWISRIKDWLTRKSVGDVQVLLGFMNSYRRFIRKYGKVTLSLTQLLKKTEASPRGNKVAHSAKWEWMWQLKLAFRKQKMTITKASILHHLDLVKPISLQTDVSGVAIGGILNQYDSFGDLRPVNYYSRNCSSAKENYDTYDRELLAIVEKRKQW